jgi:hypothetical protein
MSNFSLRVTGQVVSASSAGAATLVDNVTGPGRGSRGDVLVYNPGPSVVRVRAGDAGVVADATCQPILAGEKGCWHKGDATHLAAWVASGTQDIEVFVGSGS